jgi:hypothetical protein
MSVVLDTPLLISLSVLVALIGFVVWRFGIRQRNQEEDVSFKSTERKDKLTLINGIGPTLEKRLNALGITSFKQIAGFTADDIERVNGVMNFKGRIEREKWVIQARKLLEAGSRSRSPSPSPRRQTRVRSASGGAGAAGMLARKTGGGKGSRKTETKARKLLK